MKNGAGSLALLLLRLALGPILFAHGAQKLLGWFGGHGALGFVQYVQSLGMPSFLGWAAIVVEFFGGIAVLIGFLPRLAALGFAIEMGVAIFSVHWRTGFFMNWGSVAGRGEGWEYCAALLAMSLAVAVAGPGRFALFGDHEAKFFGGS